MPDKKNPVDKRISLAPLDFEKALGGILKAGPHVEDDDTASDYVKEHHEANHKRRRKGKLEEED